MNECNSIEIDKANLTDQTKYRLNEISKIENYFIEEINQRKSCIKKFSKYVTTFDYIDKVLVVLSATSGGVSIIPFTRNCYWCSCRNSKCKFCFNFFSNNKNNQKVTEHNKQQKEKP